MINLQYKYRNGRVIYFRLHADGLLQREVNNAWVASNFDVKKLTQINR